MPSYRKRLQLPAWYMIGGGGRVVASYRATDRRAAKRMFKRHGFQGKLISEQEYKRR